MFRIFVLATALLAAAPANASEKEDAMAPIKAFVDGINKGDMKGAAAAHVGAPSIIDEFAPHHWSSLDTWAADYGKDSARLGASDGRLTMHKVHRLTLEGDAGYAVIPTDYSYKVKGKTIVEHGTITYALTKSAGSWKIAAWSYSW